MSTLNLTLLTDLYELTMMQGYYESNSNETVMPFTAKIPAATATRLQPGWIRSSIILKTCIFPMRTSRTWTASASSMRRSWSTCGASILRAISGRSRKAPSYSRTNRS